MKRHLLAGLLTLATLMVGCNSRDKSPRTPDIKPVPLNSFHKVWYADLGLGGAKATNTYVFDEVIIVYSSANNAHVVDRKSGALKFIHPLPRNAGDQHPPSVIGERIIYLATTALKVYSVKTGRLMREITDTEYAIRSGGSGMGQFFYFSANYPTGGRLVALDLEDKNNIPRWTLMVGSGMRSRPVHKDSITYFAGENGIVRAVNEQPASIWGLDDTPDGGFQAGGPVYADLAFDTGILYVASIDTKLYALQQASGQIKWRYYAGVPLYDKPEVTLDTVYLPVRGKGLVAISKNEGKDFREHKWVNAAAQQLLADDEKYAYVRLSDGRLAALDKANGKQLWTSNRRDFTTYGTNLKDGHIYATTPRGELLCIKAVTKVGVVGEIVMAEPEFMEVASR